MSFYKKDYEETRRKRNFIASISVVAVIFILFVGYNFLKKSTGPDKTSTIDPGGKPKGPMNQKVIKDLPTLIKETRQSVVLIKTFDRDGNELAMGSGFFISETGDIITNSHVFQGSDHAEAVTTQGKVKISGVQAQDNTNDLVRLSVQKGGRKFKPLKMKTSLPQVGEKIMVIGNPLGLEATVTDGIVSAVRTLPPFGRVIQISCPISPGSSGSPVMNMAGEVIGVATFQLLKGQNLNFAIPITYAQALKPSKSQDLAQVEFKDSGSPFEQGMALFERQQYRDAIPFFREAVRMNPQHAESYYHLGICYRETRATDAVNAFKTAIDLKPDYAEAYCELGIAYIQFNMKKEALETLRKARDIDPGSDKVLLYLGVAYALNDQFKAATAMLEKAVEIYPDKIAYYYLGLSYAAQTQFDKAIWAFRQCLELDADYIEAYIGLGAAYAAVENWERGIRALNEAVLKDPQNPGIHYILGILHLGNQDLPSAELEYQLVVKYRGDSKLISHLSKAISDYKYYKRRH